MSIPGISMNLIFYIKRINKQLYICPFFECLVVFIEIWKQYSGLQSSWHQVLFLWKTVFPHTGMEDDLGMIQEHYIYCALYFKSNAATDLTGCTSWWPRGWGPLVGELQNLQMIFPLQRSFLFSDVRFSSLQISRQGLGLSGNFSNS